MFFLPVNRFLREAAVSDNLLVGELLLLLWLDFVADLVDLVTTTGDGC